MLKAMEVPNGKLGGSRTESPPELVPRVEPLLVRLRASKLLHRYCVGQFSGSRDVLQSFIVLAFIQPSSSSAEWIKSGAVTSYVWI